MGCYYCKGKEKNKEKKKHRIYTELILPVIAFQLGTVISKQNKNE